MLFDTDKYQKDGILFPKTFHTVYSLDKSKYYAKEQAYRENKGLSIDQTFDNLKKRTSSEYFNNVIGAQVEALSYSDYVFPAYRFLMPDALMEDWLAIIDPHCDNRKRDHSLHQPMTAFIVSRMLRDDNPQDLLTIGGMSLLDHCATILLNEEKTQYLRDYFAELYPAIKKQSWSPILLRKFARDIFYQVAVVSALFHDIGYPWQFANGIGKSLKIADYDQKNFKSRSVSIMMNAVSNRLLAFPFHGYSATSILHPTDNWTMKLQDSIESAFYNTHGFPGALAFTHLTDEIRKFPNELNLNDAVYQFIVDWASVGILMHDMPDQYAKDGKVLNPQYRLSIDTDPLSCLIAMSDILEEFNRPKSSFSSDKDRVTIKYDSPCIATKINVVGDTLHITYLYENNVAATRNKKRREDEVFVYFNPNSGYIDLSAIGINKVECTTEVKK